MEEILVLMPWLWGMIILSTIVIELFSSDIDAIWFSLGSLCALILSFFEVHLAIQLSVFVIITFPDIIALTSVPSTTPISSPV